METFSEIKDKLIIGEYYFIEKVGCEERTLVKCCFHPRVNKKGFLFVNDDECFILEKLWDENTLVTPVKLVEGACLNI